MGPQSSQAHRAPRVLGARPVLPAAGKRWVGCNAAGASVTQRKGSSNMRGQRGLSKPQCLALVASLALAYPWVRSASYLQLACGRCNKAMCQKQPWPLPHAQQEESHRAWCRCRVRRAPWKQAKCCRAKAGMARCPAHSAAPWARLGLGGHGQRGSLQPGNTCWAICAPPGEASRRRAPQQRRRLRRLQPRPRPAPATSPARRYRPLRPPARRSTSRPWRHSA